MKKVILTLLFLGLAGAALPPKALAGFGVSPAIIKNEVLKPGSHLEKDIYLSRSDPDEDLEITIEPDLQEMNNWITFQPGNKFIFQKGERLFHLKAIFDVPKDAPYKRFAGAIRIKAQNPAVEEGGVSVVKGARLEVNLLTTEIDIADLLVRAIKVVENVRPGQPLTIGLLIENQGNVPASPECQIKITTLDGKPLETIDSDPIEAIPALQMKEVLAHFHPGEPKGEYFAEVKVFLGQKILREEKVVFKILEPLPTPTPTLSTGQKMGNMIKKINLPPKAVLPVLAGLVWLVMIGGLVLAGAKSRQRVRKLIFWALAGAIVLISLTAAVTIVTISLFYQKSGAQIAREEKRVMGASVEEPVLTITPTVMPTPQQRLKIEPVVGLKVVNTRPEANRYEIYKEPNKGSSVIYTAVEGEQFWVIKETDGWYEVQLRTGETGWLPKTSVKEVK